jgi:hypothetical protein
MKTSSSIDLGGGDAGDDEVLYGADPFKGTNIATAKKKPKPTQN